MTFSTYLLCGLVVIFNANTVWTQPCQYTGSIRLLGPPRNFEGLVQICINDRWHSLCDDSNKWNVDTATVVCKNLTFNGPGIVLREHSYLPPPPSVPTVRFKRNHCTGNEHNIICAEFQPTTVCMMNEYSAVLCSNPNDNITNGFIQLENSPEFFLNMGRLAIYYNGSFGGVCDNTFFENAPNVACNELGYEYGGIAVSSEKFGTGSTMNNKIPIFLDDIHCRNNDTTLGRCLNNGFQTHNCRKSDILGLICTDDDDCITGDVRLVDGNATAGRVELCLGGVWGTICRNNWDKIDATEVCRQLGLGEGIPSVQFPGGSDPIWATEIDCSRYSLAINDLNEPGLLGCRWKRQVNDVPGCNHNLDAGVICIGNKTNNTKIGDKECTNSTNKIYLFNGFNSVSGRVAVCGSNDRLHNICDNGWSHEDATVICTELGHQTPGFAVSGGYFGSSNTNVLYTNVMCNGTEQMLSQCPKTLVTDNSQCQTSMDVGVVCFDNANNACNNGQIRLAPTTNTSGPLSRVQTCYGGLWGYICPDGWDSLEARVVCRELDLPIAYLSGEAVDVSDIDSNDTLWLTNLRCTGKERALVNCTSDLLGTFRSECVSAGYAGIVCLAEAPCKHGNLRLIPAANNTPSLTPPSSGRLEICYNSQWATVCKEGFGTNDAVDICGELNFNSDAPNMLKVPEIEPGIGNIVTVDSFCVQDPTSPDGQKCTLTIQDNVEGRCTHYDDIGLNCREGTGVNRVVLISSIVPSLVFVIILLTLVLTIIIAVIVIKKRRKHRFKRQIYSRTHRSSYVSDITLDTNVSFQVQTPDNIRLSGQNIGYRSPSLDLEDSSPPYSNRSVDTSSRTISVSMEYLDLLSGDIIIPHEYITLLQCIGKGEFGMVYKAHLIFPATKYKPKTVAVKTLKGEFDQSDVDNLIEESLKMREFNHANVLELIGVCIDADSAPYIVLQYMANGSLLEWLKRERNRITLSDNASEDEVVEIKRELLSACLQITSGMEYLSSHKCIHRDLAARNCMMDDFNVIKISDFGLSQDIYEKNYFRQSSEEDTKLPIKWMAIESITDGVFSEKTDVWSFGVTCWEIFSGGKMPYGGVSPMSLPRLLEEGERLKRPLNGACTEDIFLVMSDCWITNPTNRPSFSELKRKFDNFLVPLADYLDFSDINVPRVTSSLRSTVNRPVKGLVREATIETDDIEVVESSINDKDNEDNI